MGGGKTLRTERPAPAQAREVPNQQPSMPGVCSVSPDLPPLPPTVLAAFAKVHDAPEAPTFATSGSHLGTLPSWARDGAEALGVGEAFTEDLAGEIDRLQSHMAEAGEDAEASAEDLQELMRQTSPVNCAPDGTPPEQPVLPSATELRAMTSAFERLGGASGMDEGVGRKAVEQVLALSRDTFQARSVVHAREEWKAGYRQPSVDGDDVRDAMGDDPKLRRGGEHEAAESLLMEAELAEQQRLRDGGVSDDDYMNPAELMENSGWGNGSYDFDEGHYDGKADQAQWQDWCGHFLTSNLFSAQLDSELTRTFMEMRSIRAACQYKGALNSTRRALSVWTGEEWTSLEGYHKQRGSTRSWMDHAAVTKEVAAGGNPFKSGDLSVTGENHDKPKHIIQVDHYDPKTRTLVSIEGNTTGIGAVDGKVPMDDEGQAVQTATGTNTGVGLHLRRMDREERRQTRREARKLAEADYERELPPHLDASAAYTHGHETLCGRGRLSAVDFEDHVYLNISTRDLVRGARGMGKEVLTKSPDELRALVDKKKVIGPKKWKSEERHDVLVRDRSRKGFSRHPEVRD